jgi:hypothetical protein
MRYPLDQFHNPAIEEPCDGDSLIDIERWCTRYNQLYNIQNAITRFCIGAYQVGQALKDTSITREFRIEAIGASVLHTICALKMAKGSIAHLGQVHLSSIEGIIDIRKTFEAQCLLIQQFFYLCGSDVGQIRKKRINIGEIEQLTQVYVQNIVRLILPKERSKGIEQASTQLLNKEFEK